ncbi:hypothetical protein [Clostridium sp.]|uniref:hypothetical protein n=1 Tax=Clostridium sp. TaxID=1506 RepID=UPI002FC76B1E
MKSNSKLIIVEGLPGSGKSTIAQFIAHQLQRNNEEAQWYYEVGLQHPLEFSSEACLSEKENYELLNRYSEFRSILETEGHKRYNRYFYKYVEIQRKYKDTLPEILIEELETFDIENGNVNNYMELKAKKWNEYIENKNSSQEITVIESSFFQGPIVTMLLEDKSKTEIKNYVGELLDIVKGSKPTLIYFYQKDIEAFIRRMFNLRGSGFTDYIIDMICKSSYGKKRKLKGIEGAISFFTEYRNIGDELYSEFNISKVAIENSQGQWENYKEEILKIIDVEFKEDSVIPVEILEQYVGEYANKKVQREFFIRLEQGNLFLYTNQTYKERLIPIYNNSFHIEASTLDIIFLKNKSGIVNRFIIGGRDTAASYGQVGLAFNRIS